MLAMRRVGAVLLLCVASGCDESAVCSDLGQQLLQMIRTECPSGSSCQGNPNLDKPTVPYAESHHDILQQMAKEGCDKIDLGQAPWFCNPGDPRCPSDYICCFESLSDICRKQCMQRDGG